MRLPEHILMGSTLPNLVRLLADNRAGIAHWHKAGLALACSALLSPARVVERALTARSVAATPIVEPPVFVLGHWRSGTTHLHSLLAQDPRFGYVTTLQGLFPFMCATAAPLGRLLLSIGGPRTRPMDAMAFAAHLPWEEEPCIGNVATSSGLNAWYFPHRSQEYFDRFVTFATASPDDVRAWQDACLWTLRKATYLSGGRRLVAKNPWSTARVPQLLELFPDAAFVHIYRNPYEVFASSWHGFKTGVRLLALRDIGDDEARELVFRGYRELLSRFLDQRAVIRPDRLVEVAYETLVSDPIGTLEMIYRRLGLGDFAAVRPRVESYLATLASYRTNRYVHDAQTLERVAREWAFTIDRWGYAPPAA